jgi:acyl dehydratase
MLYFEDLTPGRVFETASHTLSEDEIIAFASQFDPQPFHTDPEAAKTSVLTAWRHPAGTPAASPCG